MQVLSQLSYSPTFFVSVHSSALLSGATRPDSSPDCSAGEFRAPRAPACTISGSLCTRRSAYCSRVIAFRPTIAQGTFFALNVGLDRDVTLGTATYEKVAPGLAQYLHDAIKANAARNGG